MSCDNPVQVLPGARVPADGEVLTGASYVDESMITGEPAPVSKRATDPLISGAQSPEPRTLINLSARLQSIHNSNYRAHGKFPTRGPALLTEVNGVLGFASYPGVHSKTPFIPDTSRWR